MKKMFLLLSAIVLLSLAWMGFIRKPLPPVPEICAELSPKVDFNFSINSMNYSGVELALNNKVEGKEMYIQFKMANAWKTGRPGLVLTGIKGNSSFSNGMSAKKYLDDEKRKAQKGKDFSDFMKDNSGRSLNSYAFQQVLVEGNSGKNFMQISYDGPAMEMLQTLEVERPITLPAHISRKFTSDGIIQFQPGTIAFDKRNKGFNIPVIIR